jgi:hypothetical protein
MRILVFLAVMFVSVNAYALDWTTAYPGLETLPKFPMPGASGAVQVVLPAGGAMTRAGGSVIRTASAWAGRLVTPIAIGLSLYEIYRLAKEKPTDYPALQSALSMPGEFPGLGHTGEVGTVYNIPGLGGHSLISATYSGPCYHSTYDDVVVANGYVYVNKYWGTMDTCEGSGSASYVLSGTAVSNPPATPATQPQFENNITSTTDPTQLASPAIKNDIDRMITNNYNNSTTNFNYNPTTSNIFNDYTQNTKNIRNTSVTNQTTTAGTKVQQAEQAVTDAQQRFDANPTDQNYQTLQDAKTSLQESKMDQATAETQQAQNDVDNVPPPEPPGPDNRTSFDWSKWRMLKNIMTTVFPFSLISSLSGYVSLLVAEPVAPSFNLPLYGNNIVISLAIFDPLATICRWILSLLMVVGSVQLIIYFYRGGGQ